MCACVRVCAGLTGWAWQTRATSSQEAPYSMARAASLIISPAPWRRKDKRAEHDFSAVTQTVHVWLVGVYYKVKKWTTSKFNSYIYHPRIVCRSRNLQLNNSEAQIAEFSFRKTEASTFCKVSSKQHVRWWFRGFLLMGATVTWEALTDPMMWAPSILSVSLWLRIFTKPSVSEFVLARLLAAKGNLPTL